MSTRDAIRAGAIAGVVTIYLALVGLIERFDELNLVGTEVTFARLALIAAGTRSHGGGSSAVSSTHRHARRRRGRARSRVRSPVP